MTPMQAIFQVQKVAAETQEADGSTYIFSSAGEVGTGSIVATDFSRDQMGRLPAPSCVINLGAEDSDEESPRISRTLQLELLLFVERLSNPYGSEQLREMTRIQDRLLLNLFNRVKMAGVQVTKVRKSAIRPAPVDGRPLSYRALSITCQYVGTLADDDRLPPASGFTATAPSDPQVDLAWTRPTHYANRWDYVGIIIRRKSGSAPTSVTDGTSVQTVTDNASTTDTPGLGTHYYSVFAAYDEDGDGVADEYSSAVSDSVTVTEGV